MDFNRAFHSYDSLEGANCQTVFGERLSQRAAAVRSVKRAGLNQICEVDEGCFDHLPQFRQMFSERLALLKSAQR